MAVETIKSRAAKVLLEHGTDSQGNIKLVSLSLGTMSKDRWDADKVLAISAALEPCLNDTLSSTEGTSTFTINPAN